MPGLLPRLPRIRIMRCFQTNFVRRHMDARVKHGHDGVWSDGSCPFRARR
ncbi:hypothetical protein MTBLM5_70055 [Magnetospirillum sp. LM-5]|nr:hypothetical protein MTBLM5_70055 [Magnetospirillum sp. LM-5]